MMTARKQSLARAFSVAISVALTVTPRPALAQGASEPVAKRLLDYGIHSPTTYFPLLVPECLLIEPTETETKQTLDEFVDALTAIQREAQEQPELVKGAPHLTRLRRLDETRAARKPVLRWTPRVLSILLVLVAGVLVGGGV